MFVCPQCERTVLPKEDGSCPGCGPLSEENDVQRTHIAQKIAQGADADAVMGKGLLWLGGGLAVTVFTRIGADDGGMYVVAYGPMIYGAICLFSGFVSKLRA